VALANVREAIEACLEVRAEQGMPLVVKTYEVEVAA
jgi:predicted RNase H-like HicB family nuclease